ncbi:hypothetical protein RHGRI_016730 [Rhododendron griersonianum]|uniref:Uncharacterized protein n=1 Tax=Rhododendron griersonianum TaxID=479676 RepID=A0AAV6JVF4_9ERIC|nr:hypothetical protein RHGRI_016730 [Rhododendron griersonianum]
MVGDYDVPFRHNSKRTKRVEEGNGERDKEKEKEGREVDEKDGLCGCSTNEDEEQTTDEDVEAVAAAAGAGSKEEEEEEEEDDCRHPTQPNPPLTTTCADDSVEEDASTIVARGRASNHNHCVTMKHCFPSHWSFLHNAAPGCVVRIVLAWDAQLFKVDVIFSSSQLIVVKVLNVDQLIFYISCVYGHNLMVDRRVLWADMKSLAPAIGDAPWLQLGDLNVVRRLLERLVGFDNSASLEFNSCLDDICMDDMPFKGLWFTWSNKRGGLGNIKSKMDRVLVNGSWLDAFLKNQRLFFWLLEYQITALFW